MEIEFKLTLEILIGLIGSIITTYFIFYKNIKSNLQQSIYREEKIKLLSTHKLEQKYKISLKYIISWLDSIYQTSSFITNYSRHITIALCYSFFIFIIFWLLGTEGKVGSIQIINNLPREEKFLIVVSLCLYSSIIFLSYNKNYSLKILIPILLLGSITLEVILLNIGSYIGINFSGLILFCYYASNLEKNYKTPLYSTPFWNINLITVCLFKSYQLQRDLYFRFILTNTPINEWFNRLFFSQN